MKAGCLCLVSISTLLRVPIVSATKPVRKTMNSSKNNSMKDHTFTVFVEGNIGSGKTSFLNHFSKFKALVLAEPVETWRNMHGYNFLVSFIRFRMLN